MIGGRRPIQGRKPGDRRVRVERPHSPYFRYTGPGQLTAKEAANVPSTRTGRAFARIRAVVLGKPLSSESESEERLSKVKALAIFSSDAISSSAYATEEIIRAFILAGAALLAFQYAIRGRDRDRDPPRDRRLQLPPDLHRLPDGRWLVLGLEGRTSDVSRRWWRRRRC